MSSRSWPRTFHASHTSSSCCSRQPHKNKTPSQIGQTSLSLASWSPFTNMGCAAPAMDVFVSSLIARGMGVLVDVDAYHVHRSSSLVFSRLLSSSLVFSRLRGWVRLRASHLGSARPRVSLALSDAHPNPCLRQPVNNSYMPTCSTTDCLSRLAHSRRCSMLASITLAPTCPCVCLHDSFSPHLSISRPFCLPPPSRARVPPPRVSRETHSHPCSSPTPPTLHFSITCSAPHTPPTAPVRRSGALSPPTPHNSTPHLCKARIERSRVPY